MRKAPLLLALAAFVALAPRAALAQERIKNVIYLQNAGVSYTMDVFKPKEANGKALVWLVSGGWFSNVESINPDIAKAFNDKGYTVFEVVHGSQPKYTIPEIIPQLQRALRFIHANAKEYGINPNEVGVSGASAGGHLSLMLGGLPDTANPTAKDPVDQASSKVNAVVAFMPPTDFLDWGKDSFPAFKMPMLGIFMPAFGVTAKTPEDVELKLGHDLSPIYLVSPTFAPTLLVHGDKDPLVPIQQSTIMDAALAKASVDHKFVTVPGGAHDGVTFIGGVPAMEAWFDSHLTGK